MALATTVPNNLTHLETPKISQCDIGFKKEEMGYHCLLGKDMESLELKKIRKLGESG